LPFYNLTGTGKTGEKKDTQKKIEEVKKSKKKRRKIVKEKEIKCRKDRKVEKKIKPFFAFLEKVCHREVVWSRSGGR
jgi:hypothetical protein